jgi:geranylgeranylglycerol-phosphate geranylgeranyltransferase
MIDNAQPINKLLVSTEIIRKKTTSFVRMIRPTNLLPTMILSLGGGIIMKQNIVKLLLSKQFMAANIIVLLIMANSMILNDIFDIPIDKINNPDRPLITGEITINESIFASLFIFIISEVLNVKYVPQYLRHIPRFANLMIFTYTPILKRIIFIKNLSCSALVSSTLLFTGLSACNSEFLIMNKNFGLLALATQLVFTGSFYNEVLLDISDITGDKQNRIYTIPVLLGEIETLKMVWNITMVNFLWCIYNLSYMYSFKQGTILFLLCFPFFKNLTHIRENEFSKESIQYSVKATIKPMIVTLFFICILSIF